MSERLLAIIALFPLGAVLLLVGGAWIAAGDLSGVPQARGDMLMLALLICVGMGRAFVEQLVALVRRLLAWLVAPRVDPAVLTQHLKTISRLLLVALQDRGATRIDLQLVVPPCGRLRRPRPGLEIAFGRPDSPGVLRRVDDPALKRLAGALLFEAVPTAQLPLGNSATPTLWMASVSTDEMTAHERLILRRRLNSLGIA